MSIESFATALKLAEVRDEGFTAEDVAEMISSRKGGSIHAEDIEKLHELLVD